MDFTPHFEDMKIYLIVFCVAVTLGSEHQKHESEDLNKPAFPNSTHQVRFDKIPEKVKNGFLNSTLGKRLEERIENEFHRWKIIRRSGHGLPLNLTKRNNRPPFMMRTAITSLPHHGQHHTPLVKNSTTNMTQEEHDQKAEKFRKIPTNATMGSNISTLSDPIEKFKNADSNFQSNLTKVSTDTGTTLAALIIIENSTKTTNGQTSQSRRDQMKTSTTRVMSLHGNNSSIINIVPITFSANASASSKTSRLTTRSIQNSSMKTTTELLGGKLAQKAVHLPTIKTPSTRIKTSLLTTSSPTDKFIFTTSIPTTIMAPKLTITTQKPEFIDLADNFEKLVDEKVPTTTLFTATIMPVTSNTNALKSITTPFQSTTSNAELITTTARPFEILTLFTARPVSITPTTLPATITTSTPKTNIQKIITKTKNIPQTARSLVTTIATTSPTPLNLTTTALTTEPASPITTTIQTAFTTQLKLDASTTTPPATSPLVPTMTEPTATLITTTSESSVVTMPTPKVITHTTTVKHPGTTITLPKQTEPTTPPVETTEPPTTTSVTTTTEHSKTSKQISENTSTTPELHKIAENYNPGNKTSTTILPTDSEVANNTIIPDIKTEVKTFSKNKKKPKKKKKEFLNMDFDANFGIAPSTKGIAAAAAATTTATTTTTTSTMAPTSTTKRRRKPTKKRKEFLDTGNIDVDKIWV